MIDSLENKQVKTWTKLHSKKYRDEYNQFLVEEQHLILEALSQNVVDTIICSKENIFEFDNIIEVSQRVMNKLSQNKSEVHYIALCNKTIVKPNKFNRVILLDNIQDPANIGAIIRSAVAFNYDKIYVSNDCADIYNEKAIRASQGALFKIAIEKVDLKETIKLLKDNSFKVYATSLQNSQSINDVITTNNMAFIFGNEGNGVKQELIDLSHKSIIIPINNFESLNVSVATGIVLYKFNNII